MKSCRIRKLYLLLSSFVSAVDWGGINSDPIATSYFFDWYHVGLIDSSTLRYFAMAERISLYSGILCRNSLFSLFLVTSVMFIVSCFFVLRSTGRPYVIGHNSPPASTSLENSTPVFPTQSETKPSLSFSAGKITSCAPNKPILKVFMYDLPSEFHFGLMGWKPDGPSVWPHIRTNIPPYPGGLNLQHSIEYWLTLDLLFSEFSGPSPTRTAIRVHNSSEADIIFVPFFSSLSYNRFSKVKPQGKNSQDKLLQQKLVNFLVNQEEWRSSGGINHIIVAHHPNSLLEARNQLWPAMFILADFGRYPTSIANIQKDVIAPYRHVIKSFVNDTSTFDSRPTLLYFQGAIYRKDGGTVRQELYYLLRDEKDVHFAFGSIQRDGIKKATEGMHSSKFCLNIAGDTPSSNRLFDAIVSHCVPVIISDDIELPFEDVVDYSEFCVFVRIADAVKENYLINFIRGIRREEWTRMWNKLKEVERLFEFRYPSREDDAVQMIWQAVAQKVPAIRLKLHRSRRYSRTRKDHREDKEAVKFLVPRNFRH